MFASSCSIYGAASEISKPLDETAPFNPVSAYAVSKVKSEEGLSVLADENFSPVFMRNATAFGVSPRMRFDLVLNNLMGWAYVTGVIKVMSDGTPWRPLVHIEDISLAALAAAEAPRDVVHNQPFNIGRNDANYQVKDIAAAVNAVFPKAGVTITGETGGDPRSYRVDFTKALSRLPGFQPRWSLADGCEEIAKWLRTGALRDNTFEVAALHPPQAAPARHRDQGDRSGPATHFRGGPLGLKLRRASCTWPVVYSRCSMIPLFELDSR